MLIQVKDLNFVPKRHSDGAAGYDIYAIEDGYLQPNSLTKVNTGLKVDCPDNLGFMLFGRSGFAIKNLIEVETSIVKKGYIYLNMINNSDIPFYFKKGDRIAQMVCVELGELDS
ncbi:Deoxyuridine 5'-triphosphate nucleotidohydrolase [Dictyocoela muelleri]|nr:Deoxyuridine 5'-triphosphate nucleotidohydrolase [Dictyocoela muelleri]